MTAFGSNDDLALAIRSNDAEARQAYRALSRRSFYFFTKAVICFGMLPNLMTKEVFKERQDWLQWIFCDHKRGLLEDPRSFAKTTGSTRAGPCWLAIQRPHPAYDATSETKRALEFLSTRQHLAGPDSIYVLISDSKDIASRWVGSSYDEWRTNEALRWMFPEMLWPNPNKTDYGIWSRSAYFLPGRQDTRNANPYLRPAGLASRERGGRADGLFIDDIVGGDDYIEHLTESELSRRWNYITSIPQLLKNLDPDSSQGGFVLVTGNRLALDDVNSRIHDEMPRFSIWHRSAFRCSIHDLGNCGRRRSDAETDCAPTQESLWTARYPDAESLARVAEMLGQDRFDTEWLNDPHRKSDLDVGLVRPFLLEAREVQDPGTQRTKREWCIVIHTAEDTPDEVIPLHTLSRHAISIDPASSRKSTACRTAIVWLALDASNHRRFLLDCRADRWKPGQAIPSMLQVYEDAQRRARTSPAIICEKVAAQEYVSYALGLFARERNVRIPKIIDEPVPHGVSKEDKNRRRVGSLLNQGLLYIRADLQLPRMEIRHFPTGTMDTLDGISQAETLFQRTFGGRAYAQQLARRRAARERRVANATTAGASY